MKVCFSATITDSSISTVVGYIFKIKLIFLKPKQTNHKYARLQEILTEPLHCHDEDCDCLGRHELSSPLNASANKFYDTSLRNHCKFNSDYKVLYSRGCEIIFEESVPDCLL